MPLDKVLSTSIADGAVSSSALQSNLSLSGNLQFNSGYGSVATAYGCRAWVNFNGTGVVAIRASGNVTSITDNGTGDYTVNFTNAMPDANYAVSTAQESCTVANDTAISGFGILLSANFGTDALTKTTTATRFLMRYLTATATGVIDVSQVNITFFR